MCVGGWRGVVSQGNRVPLWRYEGISVGIRDYIVYLVEHEIGHHFVMLLVHENFIYVRCNLVLV